ncbi:hypothetical protein AU381_05880 [Sinorhizobium glycinis]|uniref:Uncharacterized protein n=1 Tax=Sinorhizobium glycinis TaxID=1472378 RepID=A0A178Y1V7_9HYPH|nr:hypothetical protein AU381_05880 [Sinorhizobium glycinis]
MLSQSSITIEKLRKQFVWSPREQWASHEHPVFQITAPYVFTSETPCYLNQAFPRELIGRQTGFRLIEGRFPIHNWPRPLSWAVEWLNPDEDIILKRGQPWFDLCFETDDPASSIALRKQEMSDELRKRLLETKDVTSYIRGTSKLMGK